MTPDFSFGAVTKKIFEFLLSPFKSGKNKDFNAFSETVKRTIRPDGIIEEESKKLGVEYRSRSDAAMPANEQVMKQFEKQTQQAVPNEKVTQSSSFDVSDIENNPKEIIDHEQDFTHQELEEFSEAQLLELLEFEEEKIREEGGAVEVGFEDDYNGLT